MEQILFNLALIDLTNFCTKHELHSPEGSHCIKRGRGFTYSLISNDSEKILATVTFRKHSIPEHRVGF